MPASETFTVAVSLQKGLANPQHVALITNAAERAHNATRLASRLLNFHLLKCLERGLPLPPFGHTNWSQKAWHCVTVASRQAANREPDPELVNTFNEFMPGTQRVNSTKLGKVMQFEADRWSVVATNNIYVHFAARAKKYAANALRMDDDAYQQLDRAGKLAHKTTIARVAFDLCSPTGKPLKSPPEHRAFVAATRALWRLDDFPWDGKPLAYHLKANDAKLGSKCHAHLLLPAMWHMRIQQQVHGRRGFALLPLRTTLKPGHTHFGADALRSLLGVGLSEHTKQHKKQRMRETRAAKKKQRLDAVGSTRCTPAPSHETDESEDEDDDEPPVAEPSKPKRTRRPKAVVEGEKRRDLMRLFDLKRAGVDDCQDKTFDCTFTSDGVGMHLQFSRPSASAIPDDAFPRRGIWGIDELRERLVASGRVAETPSMPGVDELRAPLARMQKVCSRPGCACYEQPIEGLICVGCDPGKNEPANIAEPLSGAKLRVTASGRRHATKPGNWTRTGRHKAQSAKKGQSVEHDARDATAAAYRSQFVDKPNEINLLESELGREGCSTAPCLLHFGLYVDTLRVREPVLLPHYAQLHHRKLRRKAHIERQRFESRFIRDIKRTFDPDKTKKTIVIAWGAWGKIAGRPGGVGNRGLPPTIGVSLARRVAKENGIVVAWTPEHKTTATHFKCGGECRRFAAAEQRRADDHNQAVREIRGLKVCQNPECRAPVNRDLNAALNIATNGVLLLLGHRPIASHTAPEVALLNIENSMHSA